MVTRICLILFYSAGALSLTCYVHSGDGNHRIVTKPEWTECIIMPRGSRNDTLAAGLNSTIEVNKWVENGVEHNINWRCIDETIDYSGHPAYLDAPPLNMFTCSCYTDECNTLENFRKYLKMAKAAF